MSMCCLQEVEAKFEKFGEVKEARIVRNPVNGESRGFGFVAMKYEEDVDVVGICSRHIPHACLSTLFSCSQSLSSFGKYSPKLCGLWMQAIRTLDGAEWQGRRLGVERARNVKYAPTFPPDSMLCSNTLTAHMGLSDVVLQPSQRRPVERETSPSGRSDAPIWRALGHMRRGLGGQNDIGSHALRHSCAGCSPELGLIC